MTEDDEWSSVRGGGGGRYAQCVPWEDVK